MNVRYPKAKESSLTLAPSIDWDTDTIKAMLVKTAEAYDPADQFVADLTAGNIVARSAALANKTATNGVARAANLTFVAPPAGQTCNLILYKDTGSDATSPLIAFIDTGTGFPIATNGLDVQIQWDPAGIFAV